MTRFSLFALLLAGLLLAEPAWAFRCGSKIVDIGDRKFDVKRRCGDPSYTDSWVGTAPGGIVYNGDVEEWYYNFGPYRLVHILTFRNGRLNKIDTAGYGSHREKPGQCQSSDIAVGQSVLELYLQCGQPVSREQSFRRVNRKFGTGLYYPEDVKVEEWIYNFGPNQFLRYVKLVNGKVVNISTGDRGY